MAGLLRLSRSIDRMNDYMGEFASWALFFACMISAGNAIIRYGINYSSNGWLEAQWYLFGAAVLLGASNTLRKNEHVRVDLVYSSVSERARLWMDAFGITFFLLPVTITMAIICFPFFWDSFVHLEESSSAGGLLRWPVKIVLPLGFALLSLQGISELIKRVAALLGVETLVVAYEKPLQ